MYLVQYGFLFGRFSNQERHLKGIFDVKAWEDSTINFISVEDIQSYLKNYPEDYLII